MFRQGLNELTISLCVQVDSSWYPISSYWHVAQWLKTGFGLVIGFINHLQVVTKTKNSVVLVRKRAIPTEQPQPAGEVSANFSW
jgi:hypothetical protein